MQKRRAALRVPAGVLALAFAIVLAGPVHGASAALVGLQRSAPATPPDSAGSKEVTAFCPAGKQLLGAGGDTTPGDGDVLLDDIRPSADLKTLKVNAVEDPDGASQSWFVQAFAICAVPPPGLERVAATSALNSANKSVVATCPAGRRLLGTGAEVNGGNRHVLLEDITPNSGLTAVTVKAVEDESGTSGNWSVIAYAICAQPVAGLERVSLTSDVDSTAPKVVEAECPLGKQVVGMAGNINSPNGQVVLDAVFADAELTTVGFAAGEDDTGNTANWGLTAFAICANSAERVVDVSAADSTASRAAGAECQLSTGHKLTGLGGDITGAIGQVSLQSSAAVHCHERRAGPRGPDRHAEQLVASLVFNLCHSSRGSGGCRR